MTNNYKLTPGELSAIEESANNAESIVGTKEGELFNGDCSTLQFLEGIRVLKGKVNGKQTTVIYYEYGLDRYITYDLEDYGKTWGFSPDDLITWRLVFLSDLKKLTPLEKFCWYSDKTTDYKLLPDIEQALIEDLKEIK